MAHGYRTRRRQRSRCGSAGARTACAPRGYGQGAAAMATGLPLDTGKAPMYAHHVDNRASAALADALGLRVYGWMIEVSAPLPSSAGTEASGSLASGHPERPRRMDASGVADPARREWCARQDLNLRKPGSGGLCSIRAELRAQTVFPIHITPTPSTASRMDRLWAESALPGPVHPWPGCY